MRGLLERRGELVGNDPGLVDVGFDADSPLRTVDGLEHRREDLVAIGQDVVVVPVRQIAADQSRDVRRMPGLAGARVAAHLQGDLILRKHEKDGDDRSGNEQHEQGAVNWGSGHCHRRCKFSSAELLCD